MERFGRGSAGKEGDSLHGGRHLPQTHRSQLTWGRLIFLPRQSHGVKDQGGRTGAGSFCIFQRFRPAGEETDSVKKNPRLSVPSCDIAGLAAAFLAIDGKRLLV